MSRLSAATTAATCLSRPWASVVRFLPPIKSSFERFQIGPTSRRSTFPVYAFASTTQTPVDVDEDVIDISAGPGDQAIVQRNHDLADFSSTNEASRLSPALPFPSWSRLPSRPSPQRLPRRGLRTVGGRLQRACFYDARLRPGRRAGRPGIGFADPRGAGETSRLPFCATPIRLGASRQRDAAARAARGNIAIGGVEDRRLVRSL